MSAGYSAAFKRGTLGRIPLGRWGTDEEVAAAALFLASDDGSLFHRAVSFAQWWDLHQLTMTAVGGLDREVLLA